MKKFSYLCIGYDGEEVSGFLFADSDEAARIKLMGQGLKIIRVDLCETSDSTDSDSGRDEAAEITEFEVVSLEDFGKSVWSTEPDSLDTVRKSSQYQIQGLPLSASLRTLSEEAPSRSLARTFERMAVDLEQGRTPEETFQHYLQSVPQNLSSLIRVSASTGKLESVIEDYIESERLLKQSRHKLLTVLSYAAFLILGSLILFYFLFAFILRSFKELLLDLGTELPGLTISMFRISDVLSKHGVKIMLITLGSTLLIWFSFDFLRMQAARRRIINLIPVFGAILSNTAIAQFCRILAGLIDAGVKLPDALTLAAQMTRDPNLIAGCEILIKQTHAGFSLMESAQSSPHFNKSFIHLFRWQDQPQIFVESLRASSNIYQAKADMKTGTLIFILQPVLIIGMLFLIGIPILALYMPLIKALKDLA
ncbi:type II secretion system F family protein [Gimesia panareensis]|uniref:type II secretion system F family protein n=1 Tax=Gimesia panareensis TaxID=2527978 RepID=UPI00118A5C01|nr:type II secretion system F family protein [Gimesia panareensis]QDU53522.1 Type II secretion system protein F [Gimesia panareensis]